jgi:hypothetical protein
VTENKGAMDTETLKHLLALREVNKALMDGLKAAVYRLEKAEEISDERRKSMVKSLNGLIAENEAAYGEGPTRHSAQALNKLLCLANQNEVFIKS